MTLGFFLIIVVVRIFQNSLKKSGTVSQWSTALTAMMYISIAAILLEIAFSGSRVLPWFGHVMLVGIVYLTFTQHEFRQQRSLMYAILPFVAIDIVQDLIKLVSKSFYNKWEDYFDNGISFALLWMLAMWFITNRQRKALEKERVKTKQQEEENKITVALKAQLEVQVAERTAELTLQKEELQHALNELRDTQAQLIQAEKMCSLGELTAGIAHEIQNPLNFVNNFSEVNAELIEELHEELKAGNHEDALAIAADIKENEQKISLHGKRADSIVKGMLQHSRKNTGQKEPADINALADEYLRLSYHGLRAKDKMFNAAFKTDFDQSIGKIDIVPQDMGRVLLNLFNNAFYAVTERKKTGGENYEPWVLVTTRKLPEKVEIVVKDNGNGVPTHIAEKIFQPFFTTKPTGQGTGLGLSLSYDIIKAHGGEIKMETREGEGTEFIITLPLT